MAENTTPKKTVEEPVFRPGGYMFANTPYEYED